MPRPNLKDTFLKSALKLSKKGTTIFYHGFGTKEEVLSEIKKDTKNKIGKIKSQNKKLALLQDKAEQYKRNYVHVLMDIEKELGRKNKPL